MTKGDIVLITFPFTDLRGKKLRPAVILSVNEMDLTVCFVTSQLAWRESTDILILPDEVNGMRKESLIRTNKIATLDKALAKGLLGKLTILQIGELNRSLIKLFELG
ncbi:MAG: type II toxin-antitoxin system PemK/MazF family toxin [Ginsengibacter sp.]